MKMLRLVLLVVVLAAFGACGGDGDVQAFCDKQEELDSIDVTDTEALSEAIDDIAADAPEEIKDDVELLRDALTDLEEVDTPEEAQELMTTEIQEASRRMETWVEENCEEG